MEIRNYHWLLKELSNNKSSLPFLETVFCRGDKVTEWFTASPTGEITQRVPRQMNRTKFILTHYLNRCHINDYFTTKYLCYIFHKAGLRLITVKEAGDMCESQLSGIRSLHFLPADSNLSENVYTVTVRDDQGELHTKVQYGPFGGSAPEKIKSVHISEKALKLTSIIASTVNQVVHKLKFYMVIDDSGAPFLVNIERLETCLLYTSDAADE